MGAFGKSFEKGFIQGADTGSKAAMEGIREKIKKQEEKADKEVKTLQAQKDYEKVRTFIGGKNPELAASLGALDITDMGTDTLNKITGVLTKQFEPKSAADIMIEQGKVADARLKLAEAGQQGYIPQDQVPQRIMSASNPTPQVMDGSSSQARSAEVKSDEVGTNDTFVTKRNALGVATETKSQRSIQIEDSLKAKGMAKQEAAKEAQKAEQDFLNAELKIGNTLDSFVDFYERQKEITGINPGPISGTLSSLITGPLQLNEFRDGLLGGLLEVASASARTSMPGTRAIRAIDMFKETTVNEFNTIEMGVQNSADSYRNALTTDMSRSPEEYIDGYDNMSREEKRKANRELKSMASEFEYEYKKNSLYEIWKRGKQRGKNLLQPETILKIETSLPTFDSIEEGDANVAPGDFYKVGNEIVEAG